MCLGLRSWGWREEHIAQHQAADGYTATTETLFSLITTKHCENTHGPSTSVPASFFCPPLQVLAVLGTQGRSKCVTAAKASRWKCRLRQHLLSLRTPRGLEWPKGLISNRNRDYHELKIFFPLSPSIYFIFRNLFCNAFNGCHKTTVWCPAGQLTEDLLPSLHSYLHDSLGFQILTRMCFQLGRFI